MALCSSIEAVYYPKRPLKDTNVSTFLEVVTNIRI